MHVDLLGRSLVKQIGHDNLTNQAMAGDSSSICLFKLCRPTSGNSPSPLHCSWSKLVLKNNSKI